MTSTLGPRSRLASVALVVLLAACAAPVTRVGSGPTLVKNRLVVQPQAGWNQFPAVSDDDAPVWTVDGLTVDALKFYVGIPNGSPLVASPRGQASALPSFRSGMQPQDVIGLVRAVATRDGSTFDLGRVAPVDFLGGRGFRFEYSMVRKTDDVRLSGVAYGLVKGDELFLIDYRAPRLAFFPRHADEVETLVRTARLAN